MFESLFVAAVLGAGGPVPTPPPVEPRACHAFDADVAFADALTRAARACPSAARRDELLELAGLHYRRALVQNPARPVVMFGTGHFLPGATAHNPPPVLFDRLLELRCEPRPTPDTLARDREQLVVSSCVPAERAGPFVEVAPVAPAPRGVPVVTASYHLRNVAVADVAEAVVEALGGGGRSLRIDTAENRLVVQGSPATHARVAALVGEIDRDVPQVHVQLLVAEVPAAFLADCGLTAGGGCFSLSARELALFQTAFRNYPGREVLSRPQLLVRDNQKGHVAVGQDVPVGAPTVPGGPAETRFTGVSADITPRVMPDGKVMLRVGVQTSAPAPNPVVIRAGATAVPFNVSATQATVLVPSGQTVVLVQTKTGADGKPAAMLLVLTPTTVRP